MDALENHQHGQDEVDDQEYDSHIDGNGEDGQIDLNEQKQQQGNRENGCKDGEGDVCVDMAKEGAAQGRWILIGDFPAIPLWNFPGVFLWGFLYVFIGILLGIFLAEQIVDEQQQVKQQTRED